MENKKKSNVGLIIAIVIICIFLFFALIGFGGYYAYKHIIEPKVKETTQNTNSTAPETTKPGTNTPSKSNASSKDAKVADKDSPVELGKWALASKYAGKYLDEEYADKTYIDVPVRITKIRRGNDLSSEVTELLAAKHYKANDPKKTLEWAIVEYEVDLTDVKFGGSLGTNIKIESTIRGLDGGTVKHDDITYIGLSTIDVSSGDYIKEPGVYTGKFVTQLPKGCKDYLIKLGNSYQNGAESYFKGE